MAKNNTKLSKISALHYFKLIFRSLLLLATLTLYVTNRILKPELPYTSFISFESLYNNTLEKFGYGILIFMAVVWCIFIIEMLLRFFPCSLESMGCQKQFKRNFIKTKQENPNKSSWLPTFAIAMAWFALNGFIGILYFLGVIDVGILLIISLAYSVCDMICILFFCPFQTWFMKNKCCGSCRIYNWDFAMMFTPLIFVPHYYTWSLLGAALLLLAVWEIYLRVHPERFAEECNSALSCANCKEKLCHHKKQLRGFLKKRKDRLSLKGNSVIKKSNEKNED